MMDVEPSGVAEVIQELHQPLANGNMEACVEILNAISDTFSKSHSKIHEDTHENRELGASAEEQEARYQQTLHSLLRASADDQAVTEEKLQLLSETHVQADKLKQELKLLKAETERSVGAAADRLEVARTAYSAFLTLCGHVRLDSQQESGEVRGAVSVRPTSDLTFRLDAEELTPVQLTDRLWLISAEAGPDSDAEDGKENCPPTALPGDGEGAESPGKDGLHSEKSDPSLPDQPPVARCHVPSD